MKADSLTSYESNRQELLEEITRTLSADERFSAAWLTGSFARAEEDALSDLDLTAVVREPFAKRLCERVKQVSDSTTPMRLELFSRFGEPTVIHENHHNAPAGGTFTFVLYAGSALMVDWTLIPEPGVERPESSLLLFDKVGLPLLPSPAPENLEQRLDQISEMTAFFWMMTAISIKYLLRNDIVFVQIWLENLTGLVHEVERMIEGRPPTYHRGSWTELLISRDEQIQAIRSLCHRMQKLMARANRLGASLSPAPIYEIEMLLSFVK